MQRLYCLLAIVVALVVSVSSAPLVKRGYTIHLNSDTAFCSFMPPKPGDDVGGTENQGIPMCSSASLSSSGKVFPTGFIVTAHYVKTSTYVQVTGRMNRSKYSLKATDGGGQYDHKDISGVTCNGYKYFVNMLEPDADRYCIRCCQSSTDCNTGKSTYGCPRVVPGNYS
ncbi:hypothetical protein DM01DRAFT_1339326 [Hesseltinella vesiculosa]|uniref:Uncharacterized protein n=1 Tax=Hesseltinella vesiculosa TaxID=101127 RepID=A0A1X2G7E8_9FUNG|nr:hypothetical protein DM01DRAFT_1339326 [Hesseltinella vesiculosa]